MTIADEKLVPYFSAAKNIKNIDYRTQCGEYAHIIIINIGNILQL